jgi:hypothetical protein
VDEHIVRTCAAARVGDAVRMQSSEVTVARSACWQRDVMRESDAETAGVVAMERA